ncbi:MAG: transcriptional repressor [Clostridia bacterium]|nr:transcriptional repressor [Clostridia bacterium]
MILTRNTKQKQAVYGALCALGHPTATEVYAYMRAHGSTVSRGTVFRVLGGFADAGKIRRLYFTGSDLRYDATLAPHAHARCGVCGKVLDVPVPEQLLKLSVENFEVHGLEAEISGICADCAK